MIVVERVLCLLMKVVTFIYVRHFELLEKNSKFLDFPCAFTVLLNFECMQCSRTLLHMSCFFNP
jgi:hypothetical protein